MSTQPNPEPLITSLATFYNLLASLRYIPSDAIIHPPPGGHTNVDTEAVHEAGFDDDAIGVMRLLPYLAEDVKDHVIADFPHGHDRTSTWMIWRRLEIRRWQTRNCLVMLLL
jgi:hypothetical protein